MTHYEQQLRAALAALMAPVAHIRDRHAQIVSMESLLSFGNLPALLDILTAERREALEVLSSVIELTSPDNPAWPKAVALAQRTFETLQASGIMCEDEGCPHYGTPHGHVVKAEPDALPQGLAAPPERPPIPANVYYDAVAYRFREIGTAKDMGYDFYTRWQARALEFPTAPTLSAYLESPKMAPEPIPDHVYYLTGNDNFYSTLTGCGMGMEFFQKWKSRASEFPTQPPLSAVVPGYGIMEHP